MPKEKSKEVKAVIKGEEGDAADCKVTEEKASCEATAQNASTQTPRQKPRRRGGRGSRTRRMLAFQLMLTVKRGLPLSKLLSQRGRGNKAEFLKLQEESASPRLKAGRAEVKLEEKQEYRVVQVVKEEKEDESCTKERVSTGESTIFMPRSSQIVNPTSSKPLPQVCGVPPFPVPPPPPFTPPFHPPFQTIHCGQMPGTNWVFCGACHAWGTVIPVCFIQ